MIIRGIVSHCLFFGFLVFNLSAGLKKEWIDQIESQRENVNRIKDYILKGPGKHFSYNRLATLVDDHGPRIAGSESLEETLDYIVKEMKVNDSIDRVFKEEVHIDNWKVKSASAYITLPGINKAHRNIELAVLRPSIAGLGLLLHQVMVVRSFKELEARKTEAKGKIVVFNQPWFNYSQSKEYRVYGAIKAARYNATAVLIRSATPLSIYSVHTGNMKYEVNIPKIPAACITVEDAEYMQRLSDRKITFQMMLDIEIEPISTTISHNILAEYNGSPKEEEYVILGGHTDSWNDGALDDGAGFMIAWEAVRILKHFDFRPKRTIRLVLWTAEEMGLMGAKEHFTRHKEISDHVSLIMESDHGVFTPKGLRFTGSNAAKEILQEILNRFLGDQNMTEITDGGESSDTRDWVVEKKVPGIELYSNEEKYFYFHHTKGDTMSVLNADDLDKAALLWATVIQVISNFDSLLPRTDDAATPPNSDSLATPRNSAFNNLNSPFIVIWLNVVLIYFLWRR